jgi:hypothetical protein
MVMRKGSLFRASKMHYPEIGCPVAAAQRSAADRLDRADPVLGSTSCSSCWSSRRSPKPSRSHFR